MASSRGGSTRSKATQREAAEAAGRSAVDFGSERLFTRCSYTGTQSVAALLSSTTAHHRYILIRSVCISKYSTEVHRLVLAHSSLFFRGKPATMTHQHVRQLQRYCLSSFAVRRLPRSPTLPVRV